MRAGGPASTNREAIVLANLFAIRGQSPRIAPDTYFTRRQGRWSYVIAWYSLRGEKEYMEGIA